MSDTHDYLLNLTPPDGRTVERTLYTFLDGVPTVTPMLLDETSHVVPAVAVGSIVKALVRDVDEIGESLLTGSPILEWVADGSVPTASGGVLSVAGCSESG